MRILIADSEVNRTGSEETERKGARYEQMPDKAVDILLIHMPGQHAGVLLQG